jgi:hypothetical protein
VHLGMHCKKSKRFSRPQPRCHLPNSPWPGIIKIIPARECLISDMPAGDRKIVNLFLQRGNHFEADVSKSEW